jgi:hypothetical protein
MHITERQLKTITQIASREAIQAYSEKQEKEKQERHDRRLRNVKLLLKHYRSFKKHCENVKLDIEEVDVRLAYVTIDSDEFKLESIKRSKKKTLVMVKYTEKMMNVYKVMSEASDDPEEKRRYQIVHDLYFSDDKKTVEEVAACQNVVDRTVYRDVEKACKDLAVLLFGIDGVKFG